TPSSTADHGGRAVVGPMSSATSFAEARWHNRPWQGPIVTVVYLFDSSSESKPSAAARFRSFVVTSSQMQTKHLSPPSPGSGAGTEQPSPVTEPDASMPSGRAVGKKIPRERSNSIF